MYRYIKSSNEILRNVISTDNPPSLNISENLYHATYLPYLDDIKKYGLGNNKNKNWSDSNNNYVYLAIDEYTAESYAECSEYVPEEFLDEIVVLVIPICNIDSEKLFKDSNVILDDDDIPTTFEYHGIIPFSCIEDIIYC